MTRIVFVSSKGTQELQQNEIRNTDYENAWEQLICISESLYTIALNVIQYQTRDFVLALDVAS